MSLKPIARTTCSVAPQIARDHLFSGTFRSSSDKVAGLAMAMHAGALDMRDLSTPPPTYHAEPPQHTI